MIELKNILHHYMGTELEFKGEDDNMRLTLHGVKADGYTLREDNILADGDFEHYGYSEHEWDDYIRPIPLFRNWGDLIKPIEVDGTKFVPLQKLNEMRGVTSDPSDYNFYKEDGSDLKLKGLIAANISISTVYGCTWAEGGDYDFNLDLSNMSFSDGKDAGVSPQFDMSMMLVKWKFNAFKYKV